jgi:protein phosphatase
MKQIDCYGLTDVGKARKVNEDQFLIAELSKSAFVSQTSLSLEDRTRLFGNSRGQLLLVADGMGGMAAGELASSTALRTLINYIMNIMPWFFRLDPKTEDDLKGEIKSAIERCQSSIESLVDVTPSLEGMGTTLTMAYLLWPRAYFVHIGDSRAFILRNGKLQQITRDHTVAQQLVEKGAMQPDAAKESRLSNVLWNVIGGRDGISRTEPEIYKIRLESGDTLLLCTDGLTAHVQDSMIAYMLNMKTDAKKACRQLVNAANEAGGTDNITVVVARFLQQ